MAPAGAANKVRTWAGPDATCSVSGLLPGVRGAGKPTRCWTAGRALAPVCPAGPPAELSCVLRAAASVKQVQSGLGFACLVCNTSAQCPSPAQTQQGVGWRAHCRLRPLGRQRFT